jgi:hypothetical protein
VSKTNGKDLLVKVIVGIFVLALIGGILSGTTSNNSQINNTANALLANPTINAAATPSAIDIYNQCKVEAKAAFDYHYNCTQQKMKGNLSEFEADKTCPYNYSAPSDLDCEDAFYSATYPK